MLFSGEREAIYAVRDLVLEVAPTPVILDVIVVIAVVEKIINSWLRISFTRFKRRLIRGCPFRCCLFLSGFTIGLPLDLGLHLCFFLLRVFFQRR